MDLSEPLRYKDRLEVDETPGLGRLSSSVQLIMDSQRITISSFGIDSKLRIDLILIY
jgi:hypothetical protein